MLLFGPDGRIGFANAAARAPPGRPAGIDRRAAAVRPAAARPTSRRRNAGDLGDRGRDGRAVARAPWRSRPRPRTARCVARDPRRHRDAAAGPGAPRLRRQRLARAEDARGLDPGRGRDDPDGGARGPLGRSPASPRSSSARPRACRGSSSDLLDLSRLESGSALDEPVALDAIVRDEGERFEEPAAEAGVGLSVAAGRRAARCAGSARDLALLVRNLVDNAIRYTRPGGTVDVELATDDGEVVLAVGDTGLGIPSRDLPRIFERFYRVDRARSRETGGTGLGPVDRQARRREPRRRVEVTSELGQGTRFEVRLPGVALTRSRAAAGEAAGTLRRMTTLLLVRHGHTDAAGQAPDGLGARRPPERDRPAAGRAAGRAARRDPRRRDLLEPPRALPRDRRAAREGPPAERATSVARLIEIGYGEWTGRSIAQVRKTKLWRTVERVSLGDALPRRREPARGAGPRGRRGQPDRPGPPQGDRRRGRRTPTSIRLVIAQVAGADVDHLHRLVVDTGSITVVALDDAVPRLLKVNDTGDLAGLRSRSRKVGG